jgi:hypothetical protein
MAKEELIKIKLKCEYLNLIIIDNQKVKKKTGIYSSWLQFSWGI